MKKWHDKLKKLSYFKNYLFKIPAEVYNFSALISYFAKENENKYLEKLYTTNNIVESINSKINYIYQ